MASPNVRRCSCDEFSTRWPPSCTSSGLNIQLQTSLNSVLYEECHDKYQTSKLFFLHLSNALHNAPDIYVFGTWLNPSAFIRDRLAKFSRKIVVEMTDPKNGFPERPTVFMRRVQYAMAAFMHIFRIEYSAPNL
eukprot:476753_1